MTQVTLAEFSRLKSVSKKTVSQWKAEGRITLVEGKVDVEASQEKLLRNSRHRAKGRRAPVTFPADDRLQVTTRLAVGNDTRVLWHNLPPLCGEHLDGEDYGALTAAQRMAEAVPAVLALTAEAIGLTADQTDRLQKQFRVSLMETASLLLDMMAVPPPPGSRSWDAAPMWNTAWFVPVAGGEG
jgi:hypothetical protein